MSLSPSIHLKRGWPQVSLGPNPPKQISHTHSHTHYILVWPLIQRDGSRPACFPIGFYHHKTISLRAESDMFLAQQQCDTDYKLAQGHKHTHTHNCSTLPSVGMHAHVYVCVCMYVHVHVHSVGQGDKARLL